MTTSSMKRSLTRLLAPKVINAYDDLKSLLTLAFEIYKYTYENPQSLFSTDVTLPHYKLPSNVAVYFTTHFDDHHVNEEVEFMLQSCARWRSKDSEVELFATFLDPDFGIDGLVFFLEVWGRLFTQFHSSASSQSVHFLREMRLNDDGCRNLASLIFDSRQLSFVRPSFWKEKRKSDKTTDTSVFGVVFLKRALSEFHVIRDSASLSPTSSPRRESPSPRQASPSESRSPKSRHPLSYSETAMASPPSPPHTHVTSPSLAPDGETTDIENLATTSIDVSVLNSPHLGKNVKLHNNLTSSPTTECPRCEGLEKQLQDLREEFLTFQQSITDRLSQNEQSVSDLQNSMEDSVSGVQSSVSELSDSVVGITSKVDTLEESVDSKINTTVETYLNDANLNDSISNLSQTIQDLNDSVDLKFVELEKVHESFSATLSQTDQSIADHQSDHTEAVTNLMSMYEDLKTNFEEKFTILESFSSTLENSKTEFDGHVSDLKTSQESVSKKLEEVESNSNEKFSNLDSMCTSLSSLFDESITEVKNNHQQSVAEVTETLSQMESGFTDKFNHLESLKDSLSHQTKEAERILVNVIDNRMDSTSVKFEALFSDKFQQLSQELEDLCDQHQEKFKKSVDDLTIRTHAVREELVGYINNHEDQLEEMSLKLKEIQEESSSDFDSISDEFQTQIKDELASVQDSLNVLNEKFSGTALLKDFDKIEFGALCLRINSIEEALTGVELSANSHVKDIVRSQLAKSDNVVSELKNGVEDLQDQFNHFVQLNAALVKQMEQDSVRLSSDIRTLFGQVDSIRSGNLDSRTLRDYL
ncbi:hypothetical protein GEMRC1_003427 [Eukaryota sp. GEM-RC1]